jgi:hypothetical protein
MGTLRIRRQNTSFLERVQKMRNMTNILGIPSCQVLQNLDFVQSSFSVT